MTTTESAATTDTTAGTPRRRGRGARRVPTRTVLAWELRKLAAQARARYTLLGCLLAPVVVVLVLDGQASPPKDTLFGRHVHDSGYAVPLLILGFAAQWVLPLLNAIVAGDIFASEDHHGTWKTILTRSVGRSQIFWAKTVTAVAFALAVLVVLAASTTISSVVVVGRQPLTGLTGQLIPSGTAAALVAASWATAAAPLIGFTCLAVLLSVLTRNPAIGVVGPVVAGFLLQLLGSVGGLSLLRPYLLTTPFDSWHGLLSAPRFHEVLVQGLVVSAVWSLVCLALAHTALRRRDITGG